jgi:prevent-host-death family protein
MTKSVGVHEAKTHLSRLLEDVAAGEEVVITRRGEAVAILAPPPEEQVVLRFGIDEGRFVVPEDFDAPLPDELLAEFER